MEKKKCTICKNEKDLNEFNAEEKQLLEKAKQQDAFKARQQIELEEWKKKQQQEFEANEKRIKEKLKEDMAKHPATIEAKKQKLLDDEKANKAQAQRDFQERQQKELDKWNKEQEKVKKGRDHEPTSKQKTCRRAQRTKTRQKRRQGSPIRLSARI